MAELQRPHFAIPDELDPKDLPRLLRLMIDFTAQQNKTVREESERIYRKKTDRVTADALRTMQGEVSMDKAVQPRTGQVLYGIGVAGGRSEYAAWGDGSTPASTDPGTGPGVGSPHNLMDGVQNQDTVAQTASKGSLIAGKAGSLWDELTVGTDGHVLTADSAQTLGVKWAAATAGITTRKRLLPVGEFEDISNVFVGPAKLGTEPDAVMAYMWDAVNPNYQQAWWLVPQDYASGSVTAEIIWSPDGSASANYVAALETLDVVEGATVLGAGSAMSQTVASGGTANLRTTTTMGTFNPGAAGRFIRIVVGRDPGAASDAYTGTIAFHAVILTYTSSI